MRIVENVLHVLIFFIDSLNTRAIFLFIEVFLVFDVENLYKNSTPIGFFCRFTRNLLPACLFRSDFFFRSNRISSFDQFR